VRCRQMGMVDCGHRAGDPVVRAARGQTGHRKRSFRSGGDGCRKPASDRTGCPDAITTGLRRRSPWTSDDGIAARQADPGPYLRSVNPFDADVVELLVAPVLIGVRSGAAPIGRLLGAFVGGTIVVVALRRIEPLLAIDVRAILVLAGIFFLVGIAKAIGRGAWVAGRDPVPGGVLDRPDRGSRGSANAAGRQGWACDASPHPRRRSTRHARLASANTVLERLRDWAGHEGSPLGGHGTSAPS
jgi:hypothetical protein